FRPDELVGCCAAFVEQALEAWDGVHAAAGAPGALLASASAARLPGMVASLEACLGGWAPAGSPNLDDFGEGLVDDGFAPPPAVGVLPPDAAARAAHALAARWPQGDLPPGPAESAPLLPPQPPEAGPPRLHFRGQDYPIRDGAFTLGRHAGCDLVL